MTIQKYIMPKEMIPEGIPDICTFGVDHEPFFAISELPNYFCVHCDCSMCCFDANTCLNPKDSNGETTTS